MVTLEDIERFGTVPIEPEESRYRMPLEHDAERLADKVGSRCDVVLLGSVASGKYVDVLLPIFGRRLLFPKEFVGHGDMARGGLLLQRASSGRELTYIPVSDPSRLGKNASKKARSEAEARHAELSR
jgi:hypothetical protein